MKVWFCSGSSTSSSAASGDRRCQPTPSLSISSSRSTGFFTFAFFSAVEEAARQRADVGAPVAADLGLVAHAAERDAHEAAGRWRPAMDCPSEVLPTPGGADEAEDAAARVALELEHRDVLEDALLDVLEAVVVGVELLRDPLRSSFASARALQGRSAMCSR